MFVCRRVGFVGTPNSSLGEHVQLLKPRFPCEKGAVALNLPPGSSRVATCGNCVGQLLVFLLTTTAATMICHSVDDSNEHTDRINNKQQETPKTKKHN